MTGVTGTPSSVLGSVAPPETLAQIEFARALDVVASHAVSDPGAAHVRRRLPLAAADDVREQLVDVAELATLLADGDPFRPVALPDLGDVLARLELPGSVLDGPALARAAHGLGGMRAVVAELHRLEGTAPRAAALAVELPPVSMDRRLAAAVDPDGSIKDEASPRLRQVRRDIRDTREKLIRLLEGGLGRLPAHDVPADPVVTMRGGRYVIPVRREARSRIEGIVHGESGSGATVFIEPAASIPLGNELNRLEAAESREVIRVLRELSDALRPFGPLLVAGWEMCVAVDDRYARARYAGAVDGCVPRVAAAPAPLAIRNGRHPLLLAASADVVPFDLEMREGARFVLVSGPNTGGKTVLLKAVGLISALAQAGVIPPVGEGTTLPVFTRLFADIGDHQSLAASLSTFSAHLRALKEVLQNADERALVLVDELGTGTDPGEGAALAGAALRALCHRGCNTLATTHLGRLKELAADTPGAINASFQFDADRLAPTYHLQVGVPGRSYGLQIARRLELPAEVLRLADELQPEAERSLDALLGDLERREREIAEREAASARADARLAAEREGLDALRGELEERVGELAERERQLERTGREEARRFLLEARKRVEGALGLARAAVSEATAKEARRLVEDGVDRERTALAKLEALAREKGWVVREGGRRQSRSSAAADDPPPARRRRSATESMQATVADRAASEVDVRGMRAPDAEAVVVRALDDAVVAALPVLRIIHGKGSGALRACVAEVLKRDPRVASHHAAPPEQGGWGVTIADLRP